MLFTAFTGLAAGNAAAIFECDTPFTQLHKHKKKSVSAAAFVLSEGLMNVTNIKLVYPNLSSSTSTRSAWSPCSSFCVSICTFVLEKQVN
jgi:hypothetical protein